MVLEVIIGNVDSCEVHGVPIRLLLEPEGFLRTETAAFMSYEGLQSEIVHIEEGVVREA